MDRLTTMLVFRRVAELGSLSAAARALGLSPAAVSRQLSQLEERLGARLITRTTRRLNLTETGRAFQERVVRILDDIDEAERAVGALAQAPRGVLRINAPLTFGLRHLSPVVPRFLTSFPDVRLDLDLTDRFVDVMEEGLDVALRVRTALPDSSLVARRLGPVTRVLAASPDYLANHGVPKHPADLSDHAAIVYSHATSPTEWRFEGPQGPVAVQVRPRLTVNSGEAVRHAMLGGCGIAHLPRFIIGEDVDAGRLVPLLSAWSLPAHSLFAIWPPGRHLAPKVRVFIEFLSDAWRAAPWEGATL
ncbi:MAG: LysR family transcriptional regulator [Alphaproteobacteria bacterium]|nr:LysR family transcriptional regulator [Alphaproteobacteria bacterium]TAD89714.1 MAG: LysR family transcriptional regulator [Alphaproteobacteria bacterium]